MVKEAQIENTFIQKLVGLKYIHRTDIRDRSSLEENFRKKFEELNAVRLTDNEFRRLLEEIISPDVYLASKLLRERNFFLRDDGTPLYYNLVNTKDWCKNDFEVVNQLRINTRNSHQRYDVIILINGVPLVQLELKSYEVSYRKAMQQIMEYKSEPGNGFQNTLLCFLQLFIVSNERDTYYFANNQNRHFAFNAQEQFLPVYKWADSKNKPIKNLNDFAETFLNKCHLASIISRYMVLVATEQKLLVMRPYQIYAVKAIMDCIKENRGNGYIWHTTGSGKTLTSFKASTLLKENPEIDKCLFVVDRKDLDRQTRQEFNKFQDKCVEENTNTEMLVRRMLSQEYSDKVIVTTIQKLGLALTGSGKQNFKERLGSLRNRRFVFIFDECHRSQFGENHKAIKEFFPKAQLFGFTGTPIFEQNASYMQATGEEGKWVETKDIFQNELHAYTITQAIEDQNVLKFHIDYFTGDGQTKPRPGDAYTQQAVVEAIIAKHNAATHERQFNALFATSSINEAIDYYQLFKQLQEKKKQEDESYWPLNIACVFSPPPGLSQDVAQLQEDLQQERFDNSNDPKGKENALRAIIEDYNRQYGTNHKITEFDLYYQDLQQRIKDHKYSNADYPHKNKIDITIVVDMLLTGFDSKYLNTLYVDKRLKHHGLIQAFSRTNRILNATKPYGNILDFRQQEKAVNEAILLFSDENKPAAKEIWLVDPAPVVIQNFEQELQNLSSFMLGHGLEAKAENVSQLKGTEARAQFIEQFKKVQRLKTQLDQYTDLSPEQAEVVENLLPKLELQAFKGAYIETARRLKSEQETNRDPASIVNQLEFEFVLFASAVIDYDYIMGLIANYTQPKAKKEKMTREQLFSIISAQSNLIEEQEDLKEYISSLSTTEGRTVEQVKAGFEKFKLEKSAGLLTGMARKHGLEVQPLQEFVNNIMERMIFDAEKLGDLLAPLELGWKARSQKEQELMQELAPHLRKLANGSEISGLSAYE